MSEQYYKVKGQHLTDAANAIREKLTSEDTFKPSEFSEKVGEVYDSGYGNGKDGEALQIWKAMTLNGTKTAWARTFQNLDFSNYEFIKPIAPKGDDNCSTMFYDYKGKYLPKNLDFSGLNPSANISSLFTWSSFALLEIYDIGLPAMDNYSNAYSECYRLKKIYIVRTHKDTTFSSTFTGSTTWALEEITFEGVIGQNISMSKCPKLTIESLRNIISCLYDYSAEGVTKTLTLHADAKAKLTEDDIKTITDKGWTLV